MVKDLVPEIGIVTLGFWICHFTGSLSRTQGRAGEDVTEDLKGIRILAIAAMGVESRET